MEEKKKVFIRGHKGREQEVIDILAGLGANAPKYEFGKSDDFIYFIHHNNEIGVALVDSEVGAIIMDNYKEVELPPSLSWEEGDILTSDKYWGCYAVFKSYINDETFAANFLIFDEEMRFGLITLSTASYRLANEKEKEVFHRQYSRLWSNLKAANTVLK